MMRISMEGPSADDELRSLRSWLLDTPEMRQHAKIQWESASPNASEMGGGALDTLQLVTDNFWQIATFSLTYATWKKTRTRSPRVTIEYNGRTVTVEGDDSETVERIVQALTEG
ncbi:hypothetical protein ACFZCL_05635 [Streptomyces sp. NPDC008159]|uniref:effector-associated constant component EACC1 n=1 Tax=Streptomyces sp. NPDC008159 TaxID=3364817 RepID=UPI0036E88ECA